MQGSSPHALAHLGFPNRPISPTLSRLTAYGKASNGWKYCQYLLYCGNAAGTRYIGKPQGAYAVAKAAVIQFIKVTVVLYAAKGIRLNIVVPGLIETLL
jgi:NAD(P)-dependent dehydrogenase (short-subunit alcohol dehydrogenase family)